MSSVPGISQALVKGGISDHVRENRRDHQKAASKFNIVRDLHAGSTSAVQQSAVSLEWLHIRCTMLPCIQPMDNYPLCTPPFPPTLRWACYSLNGKSCSTLGFDTTCLQVSLWGQRMTGTAPSSHQKGPWRCGVGVSAGEVCQIVVKMSGSTLTWHQNVEQVVRHHTATTDACMLPLGPTHMHR
jgi:hypothetical protein